MIQYYIYGLLDPRNQELRYIGYNLTNLTDGGEGTTGRVFSKETLEKMSMAQKLRRRKEEDIDKTADTSLITTHFNDNGD
jgi:hypothetical protein